MDTDAKLSDIICYRQTKNHAASFWTIGRGCTVHLKSCAGKVMQKSRPVLEMEKNISVCRLQYMAEREENTSED